MRISDWSSDVCSSDLEASWEVDLFGRVRREVEAAEAEVGGAEALLRAARAAVTADVAGHYFELRGSEAALAIEHRQIETQRRSLDVTSKLERAGRQSVAQGTRVSVRVDLGGGRMIKKNKKT